MIRVSTSGQVLEVVAPFYPPFADRARGMMGRCQGGVWRFSPSREGDVRTALWECFGTDGTAVPTVTVEVMISPAEANEASIFALGRRLVRRVRREWPVYFDAGVQLTNGRFPVTSGTDARPTLGHAAPVVLEVRQVPEELARRVSAKEPERYRMVGTTEGKSCR